jgi:hypothetical protein
VRLRGDSPRQHANHYDSPILADLDPTGTSQRPKRSLYTMPCCFSQRVQFTMPAHVSSFVPTLNNA